MRAQQSEIVPICSVSWEGLNTGNMSFSSVLLWRLALKFRAWVRELISLSFGLLLWHHS